MMYLIAILLPPLAMLMVGKPMEAVICLILQVTVFGWIPAAIWSCLVVNGHLADKRLDKLVAAAAKKKEDRY
jgi:uncharacterized membrane protein YqaE (UPF0057 family)